MFLHVYYDYIPNIFGQQCFLLKGPIFGFSTNYPYSCNELLLDTKYHTESRIKSEIELDIELDTILVLTINDVAKKSKGSNKGVSPKVNYE